MHAAHRRPALAGALLTLLALAGCADPAIEPRPPDLPAATAPSSPPPTTPAPPTLPPEASGSGDAAAKAFVRHFFAAIDHASFTGDTQQLRALYTGKCDNCGVITRNVERGEREGWRIQSEGVEIQGVTVVAREPFKVHLIVVAHFTREVQTPPSGKPFVRKARDEDLTVSLIRRGEAWWVSQLSFLS